MEQDAVDVPCFVTVIWNHVILDASGSWDDVTQHKSTIDAGSSLDHIPGRCEERALCKIWFLRRPMDAMRVSI